MFADRYYKDFFQLPFHLDDVTVICNKKQVNVRFLKSEQWQFVLEVILPVNTSNHWRYRPLENLGSKSSFTPSWTWDATLKLILVF